MHDINAAPIKFSVLREGALARIGEQIATEVPCISTPFPTWNNACGEEGAREGLARSWSVVVGGADGSGKTTLAINLAVHAVLNGNRVGFINFEMTEVGLTQRYLSILSGIPQWKLSHGRLFKASEWEKASEAANEAPGMMITNSASVFSLSDIEEAYESLAKQGCKMMVVDYAQLVYAKADDGVFQRTEAVANKLRELTHRYKVISIVVSQLNREGKKLGSKSPPSRHYLQGGGAWENNANQIILIDHTLKRRDADRKVVYTRLLIDKNRHGPPVEIPVTWHLPNMRWEEGAQPSISVAAPEPKVAETKDMFDKGLEF